MPLYNFQTESQLDGLAELGATAPPDTTKATAGGAVLGAAIGGMVLAMVLVPVVVIGGVVYIAYRLAKKK